MERSIINEQDKSRNSRAYLHALKNDFDTIWLLYGTSHDSELKDSEIDVKNQMIDLLETFFGDKSTKDK